eukprot:5949199-Amphidinium_carterae.1
MCAWHASFQKPTLIATSALCLASLDRRCNQDGHVHESLRGTVTLADGQRVWRTRLAQVYPPALCKAFIACLVAGSRVKDLLPASSST